MSGIKEKLHTIKKNLKNPGGLVFKICNYDHYQFAPFFSDKLYIKCYYKRFMGKKLTSKQLKHPVSFNEKLNWKKLYDRQSIYTTMADKYEGKQYIAEKVGSEHVIPTIGIYDSVDEVPFNELPNQYVIKCTHDSGSVFICRNREGFDVERAKRELRLELRRNFYWASREWQYKNITPKIIVEKYMTDDNNEKNIQGLTDYKFYCFDGKVKYLYVSKGLENHGTARMSFLNLDWTFADFQRMDFQPFDVLPKKPTQLNKMIEIAEKLSADIPFLRVDLYYIDNQIYVGELTICPGGGVSPYTNNGDKIMGELLVLPTKSRR